MCLILNDFKKLNKYDYLIVIPSKGRGRIIKDMTARLFPENSCIYVNESEIGDYKHVGLPIVTHRVRNGYGAVINSIIRNGKRSGLKYILIVDDDLTQMESMVGNKPRVFDERRRYEAIHNAVQVMSDLEINLYLFSTAVSIVKYIQAKPYRVGIGITRGAYIIDCRNMNIFYEEGMNYYEDFDWIMQHALVNRVVLIEDRIIIKSNKKQIFNTGGCNSFRTAREEEKCREWIRSRWKSHVTFSRGHGKGSNLRPVSLVKRTADT